MYLSKNEISLLTDESLQEAIDNAAKEKMYFMTAECKQWSRERKEREEFETYSEALILESMKRKGAPCHHNKGPNQCDGCKRGLVVVDGLHRSEDGKEVFACAAGIYR